MSPDTITDPTPPDLDPLACLEACYYSTGEGARHQLLSSYRELRDVLERLTPATSDHIDYLDLIHEAIPPAARKTLAAEYSEVRALLERLADERGA